MWDMDIFFGCHYSIHYFLPKDTIFSFFFQAVPQSFEEIQEDCSFIITLVFKTVSSL